MLAVEEEIQTTPDLIKQFNLNIILCIAKEDIIMELTGKSYNVEEPFMDSCMIGMSTFNETDEKTPGYEYNMYNAPNCEISNWITRRIALQTAITSLFQHSHINSLNEHKQTTYKVLLNDKDLYQGPELKEGDYDLFWGCAYKYEPLSPLKHVAMAENYDSYTQDVLTRLLPYIQHFNSLPEHESEHLKLQTYTIKSRDRDIILDTPLRTHS